MPETLPKQALDAADAAVEYAKSVRRIHRRRTDRRSPQRQHDIHAALDRLRSAMGPLRSESGRFKCGPQTVAVEAYRQPIRAASAALQAERRKLWKMLPHDEQDAA